MATLEKEMAIPRRKWQPAPVFLPGDSHGQVPSPLGHKIGHNLATKPAHYIICKVKTFTSSWFSLWNVKHYLNYNFTSICFLFIEKIRILNCIFYRTSLPQWFFIKKKIVITLLKHYTLVYQMFSMSLVSVMCLHWILQSRSWPTFPVKNESIKHFGCEALSLFQP